jgi:type II secretion system protein I
MRKGGFSLLEVILALAVLAGSIAVLGESSRLALRNAQIARDLAHAQLLCESKMAEITAGITPAESVSATAIDSSMTASLDASAPGWLYSVDTETTDEEGLIAVRVTVTRSLPAAQHPVSFALVRWIRDPNYTSSSQSGSNSSSSGGNSSSSGTSGQ